MGLCFYLKFCYQHLMISEDFWCVFVGTTVIRWNVETRKMEAEMNCADVVPINESGALNAYSTHNEG